MLNRVNLEARLNNILMSESSDEDYLKTFGREIVESDEFITKLLPKEGYNPPNIFLTSFSKTEDNMVKEDTYKYIYNYNFEFKGYSIDINLYLKDNLSIFKVVIVIKKYYSTL